MLLNYSVLGELSTIFFITSSSDFTADSKSDLFIAPISTLIGSFFLTIDESSLLVLFKFFCGS